jgi:hypothetical protein
VTDEAEDEVKTSSTFINQGLQPHSRFESDVESRTITYFTQHMENPKVIDARRKMYGRRDHASSDDRRRIPTVCLGRLSRGQSQ